MHAIEPYYKWRNLYIASEDKRSPYYGTIYDEFRFTNKIYNYFIHPQWDSIGSPTLYAKPIFVSYEHGAAIIELMGEWNDLVNNDIMLLKDALISSMIGNGIYRFILMCDNVLNFHGDDDCYYEEWWDDIKEEGGWIVMINTRDHVDEELVRAGVHYYANFGAAFKDITWQSNAPISLLNALDKAIQGQTKKLDY